MSVIMIDSLAMSVSWSSPWSMTRIDNYLWSKENGNYVLNINTMFIYTHTYTYTHIIYMYHTTQTININCMRYTYTYMFT